MRKNITISDLDIKIQGKGNGFREHLIAKIGIGIIEFLLASVLYCYGILLSEYALLGIHDYGTGIWTSILFICSWSFIDPISRFVSEYFEDRKYRFFRHLVAVSTMILFLSTMLPNNVITYTILGGMISNIISTQVTYFATDKLDMDMKIFEAIRQVARALSLFVMPQFLCWLLYYYSVNQAKLIFASILLNVIPGALIMRCDNWNPNKLTSEPSRYQTIGRFAYQMNEMKSFNENEATILDDDDDSSSTSSEEPVFEVSQEESHSHSGIENFGASEHSVHDLEEPKAHLSPVTVQSYFLNAGVSILPGIPEEDEDDEEDQDLNRINPKRLSMISNKLEELNVQDQIRRDSIREVFSINEVINEYRPESIDKIEYIPNFKQKKDHVSVLDEIKNFQTTRHCFHCSPYRKYIWTRRLRAAKDFVQDNFVRPFYHALKNLYFYPALSTKVITNIVSTLYITLAPFIAMQKSWKQNLLFTTENVTFLLTYVAFAWGFFLVGVPLILKLGHNRVRLVFAFGLVLSGTSLWVLSAKLTNDVITFSSLLFGFGYGIVTYTEKIVFKSSIGMRPWYLVRGPLEVVSALLILLIYFLIYLHRLDMNLLLFLAALSYYFNAFLWLFLPFVRIVVGTVKRAVFDERGQQEGFFH